MSEYYILNVNGDPEPCDLMTWLQTARQNRVLASDHIGDVHVSTVFLGLDHSFGGAFPILWETMIFGGPHDQYQDRYSSKEDALAGHAKALAMVQR